TPLSLPRIMSGHFNSLYKLFSGPVVIILLLDAGLAMNVASRVPVPAELLVSFAMMMSMLVADAFALAWLGLWAGVKMTKSWVAAFATLALIVLLPSAVCMMTMFLFTHNRSVGRGAVAGMAVGWGLIGLLNSLYFG